MVGFDVDAFHEWRHAPGEMVGQIFCDNVWRTGREGVEKCDIT